MECPLQKSFLTGAPIVLPSFFSSTGDIHNGIFSKQKLPGGGKRTRTADICRAKAALYQLSYTPNLQLFKAAPLKVSACVALSFNARVHQHWKQKKLLASMSSHPSDNLSTICPWFCRTFLLAGWAMLDLNQRPHPYQGCALPTELIAHKALNCTGKASVTIREPSSGIRTFNGDLSTRANIPVCVVSVKLPSIRDLAVLHQK